MAIASPSAVNGSASSQAHPQAELTIAPPRWADSLNPSTLLTVFLLALRLSLRPVRLFSLVGLFLIPVIIVILARWYSPDYDAAEMEFYILFLFLPYTLVPLCGLLFASGIVQDELENQTLTYLLMRPIWRPAIYGMKLLAAFVVTAVFTAVFTQILFFALHIGITEDYFSRIAFIRAPKTALIFTLSLAAYSGVFGLLSVSSRRSLAVGVMYIIIVEGVFASLEFVLRKMTILYYFRVLCCRILGLSWSGEQNTWNLDQSDAPEALSAMGILLGIAVVTTLLGGYLFQTKEFRVKTPDGN